MQNAAGRTFQEARKICLTAEDKLAYAISNDGQAETKSYLSSLFYMDELIKEKIAMIEILRERSENVTRVLGGVRGDNNTDKIGDISVNIADMETELQEDYDMLIRRQFEIQRIISLIGNELERAVLELRYIKHLPIFKIAAELNCDERTIYRWQKSALVKIAILILNDETLANDYVQEG